MVFLSGNELVPVLLSFVYKCISHGDPNTKKEGLGSHSPAYPATCESVRMNEQLKTQHYLSDIATLSFVICANTTAYKMSNIYSNNVKS